MIRLPASTLSGILLIIIAQLMIGVFSKERKPLGLPLLYIGGALLLFRIFSRQTVLAFLAAGLGISIILSTGHLRIPDRSEVKFSAFFWFRLILEVVLCMLALAAELKISKWIPLPDSILFSALFIMLSSVCDLFFTEDLFSRFFYLQCIFFAFQLVYLLIEQSVLIFALLTAISLLIAFIGAYLTQPKQDAEGGSL